jgi:transglutaminase-like putative cysteine protease
MRRFPPFLLYRLGALLGAAVVLSACFDRGPRIASIDPRIGSMGEVLTIEGSGFGDARGDNRVTIAGIAPTSSSYLEWTDQRIAVRIPDFGESGLVYVLASGRKSNPALFTNRASMPQPVSAGEEGGGPRILSVEPTVASVGALVVIQGRNFGASREGGAVQFAWDAEAPPAAPASQQAPTAIDASESEFAYEQWSDGEIRVRVPDGAVTGNLQVRTARGLTNSQFFEVADRPGAKSYGDKRSYVVSYSVNIKAVKASGPNTLYLWLPRPVLSPTQRGVGLLTQSAEPFVADHRGTALYQFKDVAAGADFTVAQSYLVDVYAVETAVKPQAVKRDVDSPLRQAYTAATALIPADAPEIAKLAERIVGKERNPYLEAKKIYDWLEAEITFVAVDARDPADRKPGGAVQTAADKRGDAYGAALLFCALARARGIPCLPVAGFLVNRDRSSVRHFWAEFWIDGFGWVPVDPAMGADAVPAGFGGRADAAEYFFGNLDSQRVAFSRGQAELSPMDPRGRTVGRERGYALQTLWEEAVGGLDEYSSLWSDLTVTGVY